ADGAAGGLSYPEPSPPIMLYPRRRTANPPAGNTDFLPSLRGPQRVDAVDRSQFVGGEPADRRPLPDRVPARTGSPTRPRTVRRPGAVSPLTAASAPAAGSRPTCGGELR